MGIIKIFYSINILTGENDNTANVCNVCQTYGENKHILSSKYLAAMCDKRFSNVWKRLVQMVTI